MLPFSHRKSPVQHPYSTCTPVQQYAQSSLSFCLLFNISVQSVLGTFSCPYLIISARTLPFAQPGLCPLLSRSHFLTHSYLPCLQRSVLYRAFHCKHLKQWHSVGSYSVFFGILGECRSFTAVIFNSLMFLVLLFLQGLAIPDKGDTGVLSNIRVWSVRTVLAFE